MSVEEDTELRDIVLETLEQRGVVGRTKAMLRANIFTALEETVAPEDKIYLLNKKISEHLETADGKLIAGLIMDYFECLGLDFSRTVFEPETGFDSDGCSRSDLCSSLHINQPSEEQPLLAEVLKRLHSGGTGGEEKISRSHSHTHSSDLPSFIPKDLSSKHIAEAKAKFAQYDKDDSGTIDKDELRQLFIDMFPGFHRNMLERYVNDEFRAADTDFSAGIDFDEFLDLYRRLFISCRSVVSHDISDIVPATTPRSPSPRQSKIPIKSNEQSVGSSKNGSISPRVVSPGSKIPHLNASPGVNGPATSSSISPMDNKSATGAGEPGLAFLTDLPKLDRKPDPEMKSIDQNLADLGFDVPDDDEESIRTKSGYEDDFEKSGASSILDKSSSRRSYSESVKSGESITTEDITDKIPDNDDDDIDALLKDNDISWGNETEDKSIADDNSLRGVDYWEMVPKK